MAGSGFQGSDTGAMADLGRLVEGGAETLRTVAEELGDMVERIRGGCWIGPDADLFAAALAARSRGAAEAGERLRARARELAIHAREQDEASGPEDGSGAVAGDRVGRRMAAPDGASESGRDRPDDGVRVMVMDPATRARARQWVSAHAPGVPELPTPPDERPRTRAERLAEMMRH